MATAERAVADLLWLPELRAAPERRWDVALVVDGSPTMKVWTETVHRFRLLLERQGFRDVHARVLETAGTSPGEVGVRGPLPGAPVRPVSDVLAPGGRRIVLVLTDGGAPAWRLRADKARSL